MKIQRYKWFCQKFNVRNFDEHNKAYLFKAAWNEVMMGDNMFYSDKPIMSNVDDQLNRGGFVRMLAQALINLNSADTFSVGLYGKWGSGKTSLVNMVLNEINEQQKSNYDWDSTSVLYKPPSKHW